MGTHSDSAEDARLAKRPGFVVRLFRGDVALARTFWGFGFVVSLLLHTIGIVAFAVAVVGYINYIGLVVTPETLESFAGPIYYSSISVFLIVLAAYSVFICIAIWRSARKYAGLKLWRVLAQFCVVVGLLTMLHGLYNGDIIPEVDVGLYNYP